MGIGNHRRQQTSNIKRISTKSFSHNRKSQILRSKKQSLSENYSPKTTHLMTNSASSKRLHKQFCQAHKSTIDRPERRQRSRHGKSGHPTRNITNRTHIDSPRNFYNAPDQLVPVDEELATAGTAQTT